METSQIDLVPSCTNGRCSKKLFTSPSSDNLSNCSLLWDKNFSSYSEPFMVQNREDGIYFMVSKSTITVFLQITDISELLQYITTDPCI